MTPTERQRARRGEGDRLRGEILAATQALLLETADTSAVSIRAVADRVGVTPPSIYRHFADKDDLMMAVCGMVFSRLDEAMEKAAASAADPLEELRLKGHAYVQFGLAYPEHYRLIFMIKQAHSASTDFDADRFLGQEGAEVPGSTAFQHLKDTIHRAFEHREAGIDPPDEFAATCALWTAVHGITSLRISLPHFPWPPVDDQIDLVVMPWRKTLRPTEASTQARRRTRRATSPR
jgi:AcrR family transcriptional regulator